MADKNASFDVTTSVDLQEVDNAVNQADKEIVQRFDFKGAKVSIEFKRVEGILILLADSDMRAASALIKLTDARIKIGCIPAPRIPNAGLFTPAFTLASKRPPAG